MSERIVIECPFCGQKQQHISIERHSQAASGQPKEVACKNENCKKPIRLPEKLKNEPAASTGKTKKV